DIQEGGFARIPAKGREDYLLDELPEGERESLLGNTSGLLELAGERCVVAGTGSELGRFPRLQDPAVNEKVEEPFILEAGIRKVDHPPIEEDSLANLGSTEGENSASLSEKQVSQDLGKRGRDERPFHQRRCAIIGDEVTRLIV